MITYLLFGWVDNETPIPKRYLMYPFMGASLNLMVFTSVIMVFAACFSLQLAEILRYVGIYAVCAFFASSCIQGVIGTTRYWSNSEKEMLHDERAVP